MNTYQGYNGKQSLELDPGWQPDPRDFERSLYEGIPRQKLEAVDWTLVLIAIILAMLMVFSSLMGFLQVLPQPVVPTPLPMYG